MTMKRMALAWSLTAAIFSVERIGAVSWEEGTAASTNADPQVLQGDEAAVDETGGSSPSETETDSSEPMDSLVPGTTGPSGGPSGYPSDTGMSTTTESLGGTLGRPDLTTLDQYDTESDRRLIQQIRQVLSDDQDLIKESLQNLRIRASQGEVTLEGPVPSQADKDRIAHRVQQVAGAAQVDNRLEVSGSSSWEGTDTR